MVTLMKLTPLQSSLALCALMLVTNQLLNAQVSNSNSRSETIVTNVHADGGITLIFPDGTIRYTPKPPSTLIFHGREYPANTINEELSHLQGATSDVRIAFIGAISNMQTNIPQITVERLITMYSRETEAKVRSRLIQAVFFSKNPKYIQFANVAAKDEWIDNRILAGRLLAHNGHRGGVGIIVANLLSLSTPREVTDALVDLARCDQELKLGFDWEGKPVCGSCPIDKARNQKLVQRWIDWWAGHNSN